SHSQTRAFALIACFAALAFMCLLYRTRKPALSRSLPASQPVCSLMPQEKQIPLRGACFSFVAIIS
ncbi:MAG: hypothetical protein UFG06_06965, partial [Lachnospiraceae bacterium]|nr:hypothetical protein [Lachnospiraceae bacterium]